MKRWWLYRPKLDRQVRFTLPGQSGGLVTVKEKNSEVGVVHGSFNGVSDSILSRSLGSLL